MLHVRYQGRSFDLELEQLGLPVVVDEAQLKRRLANHLDISLDALQDYTLDRRPNDHWVIHPEAVYG